MLDGWDALLMRSTPLRGHLLRSLDALRPRQPAQIVVTAFALADAVGAALLMLPVAKAGEGGAGFLDALFTSTSALCVTGLVVVDTPSYWTDFGHVVILGLIQAGGFGIMTLASLLGLLVTKRLALRTRITAATETKSLRLGDVRTVVAGVAKVSLVFEAATAVLLTGRFALGHDEPLDRAVWLGVFHSVSAFNNAGFALYDDNLVRFVTDPWLCVPIIISVIAGGLGFPVWFELYRSWRTPRRWTVHTKIVMTTTAALLVLGVGFITALEWANPDTLGPLSTPGKLLAGTFQGVMPRTAGFNSVDYAEVTSASLLGTDVLMFIGGGSAGTAGGIKVTTFAVLLFVIYTEVRGESAVNTFDRRLPQSVQRQALTIALLSVAAVVGSTITLLVLTDFSLDQVLFEVVSAFATVGLSTGITGDIGTAGQLLLTGLMFLGRLGPITLASALALKQTPRLYELPEERPIIG